MTFKSDGILGTRLRVSGQDEGRTNCTLLDTFSKSMRSTMSCYGTDIDDCRSMQNPEMPSSPRFLKVAELAELLKVKPRTIYEMVAQNRIPYRKPPGSNILRF